MYKIILIDTNKGTFLSIYDAYKNDDYLNGNVKILVWPHFFESKTSDIPTLEMPCKDLEIIIDSPGGWDTYTDNNGNYSFYLPEGQHTLDSKMYSHHVQVFNCDDDCATGCSMLCNIYQATVNIPGVHNWTWSDPIYNGYNVYNQFYYMNEAFLYFSNVNGFSSDYWGYTPMHGGANAELWEDPNNPNGGADGFTLYVNTAGGPYAGIIYHEYTHNVLYRAYGDWMGYDKYSDGYALDEGLADYYACSIKNYGKPMACSVRRLDGKMKYYPPGPPNDPLREGHIRGQIIGGACWDLLNSLAGVDNLVYDVVDNYLGVDPTFGEFMDCILEADDNDGNIFNGTPNQNAIFSAFNDDHWIMGNYVAGTLHRDMTWEGDIVVLDNVTVPDGITLTIQPNTIINFNSGKGLTVYGTLNSQGSSEDHITYTSSQASPQKGDWDWIKFDNSSGTSILEYCDIEYAEIGIWCMNGSQVNINQVNVENCSNWGLYTVYNGNYTTVEYSSFRYNNNHGIYVFNSSPNLYHVTCTNNKYGLFCYNSSLPQVGYSTFSNNSQDGVFCGSSSHPWMYYQSSFNRGWNYISGNTERGVYAYSGSYPRLGFNSTSYPGKNTIQGNGNFDVYNGNSGTTPIYAIYNWWDYDFSPIRDLHTPSTINWDPVHPISSTNLAKFVSDGSDYEQESVLYYNHLGTQNLIESNYDKALEAFEYVVGNYPDSLNSRYALIHIPYCFEGLKRTSDIIPYLEKVSQENKNKNDLEGFAVSLSVPYLEQEGRFKEAAERCQQLRGFYQDKEINKNLLFIMANIHFYGLQETEKAKLYFEDYINNYPKDAMAQTAQDMLEIMDHRFIPKQENPEKTQANNSPTTFVLSQNYPNPFNPETEISFQIPNEEHVSLVIYNLLGQKIRSLVDTQMATGYHSIKWDGRNDSGNTVASGVYLYVIQAGKFFDVKKMVLMQ